MIFIQRVVAATSKTLRFPFRDTQLLSNTLATLKFPIQGHTGLVVLLWDTLATLMSPIQGHTLHKIF